MANEPNKVELEEAKSMAKEFVETASKELDGKRPRDIMSLELAAIIHESLNIVMREHPLYSLIRDELCNLITLVAYSTLKYSNNGK